MSITGVNDSAREHERFSKKLKEREEKHAKEIAHIEEHHDSSLKDLEESQHKNFQVLKDKSKSTLEQQADDQKRQLERFSDRFERQSQLDSRNYYDKTGRAQQEHAREIKGQKDLLTGQLKETIAGADLQLQNKEKSSEEQLYNVRRAETQEHNKLEDETKNMLQRQGDAFEKQLYQSNREFKDGMNKQIRQNFESMRDHQKSADLRLESLNNQHNNAEKGLKNSFSLRENQLIEEKNLRENELGRGGANSIANYRERLSDNLSREVSENNFRNAERDMRFSNQLSQQEHEAQQKLQDQRLSFERRALDDKGKASADRDRDGLKAEVSRRAAAHENYLNRQAVKTYADDNINHLKQTQSGTLRKLEADSQANFDDLKRNFQKRLTKIDEERALTQQDTGFKALERAREEQLQHQKQRTQITHDFEITQAAMQNKAKEQKAATEDYQTQKSIDLYRKSEEKVAQVASEAQSKLSMQKVGYEALNKQQEAEAKSNLALLENNQKHQVDRVTANYHAVMQDLAKKYETQVEEMRQGHTETMMKVRTEDDSKLKEMAQSYEFRHRVMASDYENRITEITQQQDRDLNYIKADFERQKRDLQTKAKNDVEAALDSGKKALALQESQYKEKMRLTDENNKNELAKLKRSNELLSKKS